MKHRVKVDLGEVEEVLLDIARDRVVGVVCARHSVDERRHAHFNHLEEGFLYRVFM